MAMTIGDGTSGPTDQYAWLSDPSKTSYVENRDADWLTQRILQSQQGVSQFAVETPGQLSQLADAQYLFQQGNSLDTPYADPAKVRDYMAQKGYAQKQWYGIGPSGQKEMWSWLEDANGNRVTQPSGGPTYDWKDKAAVWLTGAALGGIGLSAAGGLGAGATPAQASMMNPEAYGLATQTGLGAGDAAAAAGASYGGASAAEQAAINSALKSGAKMSIGNWWDSFLAGDLPVGDYLSLAKDAAKAGTTIYGLYQNQKAMNKAGDIADQTLAQNNYYAGRQADLAESQWKNYLDSIQPGLLEDMSYARDRAHTVAGQADELFNLQYGDAKAYSDRWKNTQVPLEDEIIANARKLGSKEEQDRLAGLAMTDVRNQGQLMREAALRNQQRMGVNPGSAAAQALAQDAFLAEGLTGASAMTGSRFAAQDRYRSGLTDAAALGRNLPGFASSAGGTATGAGGLQLNAGNSPVNTTAVGSNAMNSAGNSISSIWGNAANTTNGGWGAFNNYVNLVNNSPFSTMAGYGLGQWWNQGNKP
jgi:hypothetical protein